jgi:hypothetical protein
MTNPLIEAIVRVRPFNTKELEENSTKCIKITSENELLVGNQVNPHEFIASKSFVFDHLFDENASQSIIYEKAVAHLVKRFVDGFNSTVLAYGQTSSGKTFTCFGKDFGKESFADERDFDDGGILQRSISAIFNHLGNAYEITDSNSRLSVSFIELYNEESFDLLNKRTILKSSQSPQQIKVTTTDEIFKYLKRGLMSRTTASTELNVTSSRSHAIITITLRRTKTCTNDSIIVSRIEESTIHFVDLAGSESLKNAEYSRKKEGISINLGLLSLSNVILALSDPNTRNGHIPYRNSKLTTYLKDSLGGNSFSLFIACISPSSLNYNETCNTLRYANMTRNIKNTVSSKVLIEQTDSQKTIVSLLAKINMMERNSPESSLEDMKSLSIQVISLENEIEELRSMSEKEIQELKDEISQSEDRYQKLKLEYSSVQANICKLNYSLWQKLFKIKELHVLVKQNEIIDLEEKVDQSVPEKILCLDKDTSITSQIAELNLKIDQLYEGDTLLISKLYESLCQKNVKMDELQLQIDAFSDEKKDLKLILAQKDELISKLNSNFLKTCSEKESIINENLSLLANHLKYDVVANQNSDLILELAQKDIRIQDLTNVLLKMDGLEMEKCALLNQKTELSELKGKYHQLQNEISAKAQGKSTAKKEDIKQLKLDEITKEKCKLIRKSNQNENDIATLTLEKSIINPVDNIKLLTLLPKSPAVDQTDEQPKEDNNLLLYKRSKFSSFSIEEFDQMNLQLDSLMNEKSQYIKELSEKNTIIKDLCLEISKLRKLNAPNKSKNAKHQEQDNMDAYKVDTLTNELCINKEKLPGHSNRTCLADENDVSEMQMNIPVFEAKKKRRSILEINENQPTTREGLILEAITSPLSKKSNSNCKSATNNSESTVSSVGSTRSKRQLEESPEKGSIFSTDWSNLAKTSKADTNSARQERLERRKRKANKREMQNLGDLSVFWKPDRENDGNHQNTSSKGLGKPKLPRNYKKDIQKVQNNFNGEYIIRVDSNNENQKNVSFLEKQRLELIFGRNNK